MHSTLTGLEIYDGLGKQVKALSGTAANEPIDLSGIRPGIYLVKAVTANGVEVKRLEVAGNRFSSCT